MTKLYAVQYVDTDNDNNIVSIVADSDKAIACMVGAKQIVSDATEYGKPLDREYIESIRDSLMTSGKWEDEDNYITYQLVTIYY